jgi:hypothetical protein
MSKRPNLISKDETNENTYQGIQSLNDHQIKDKIKVGK